MTIAGRPRFELDQGTRRLRGGTVLVGGSPLRMVRLSLAGAAVLAAGLRGIEVPDPKAAALLERLVDGGLIHYRPGSAVDAGSRITAVIPARDEGRRIASLVRALSAELAGVIVVDDGSGDDTREAATEAGATVIPHGSPRGPATARNTGLRAVETELVMLIDADCLPPEPGRLGEMAAVIESGGASLVAPRVVGAAGGEGRWARIASEYESGSGPLDMGSRRSRVGPGRRVSFVPSAAMLARVDDLLAVGGFDETLRYGEDVDLVIRLDRAGKVCSYEPAVTVEHLPRATPLGFLKQRFRYGGSAVELDRRHPGAVAPARGTPLVLAAALSVPFVGPLMVAGLGIRSGRRLAAEGRLATRQAVAIVLGAQLEVVAGVGRLLVREWLPLTALLLARRRLRRLALLPLAALLADELTGRRPALKVGLGLLARASYAAGLWTRAIEARRFGALLPRTGPGRRS